MRIGNRKEDMETPLFNLGRDCTEETRHSKSKFLNQLVNSRAVKAEFDKGGKLGNLARPNI